MRKLLSARARAAANGRGLFAIFLAATILAPALHEHDIAARCAPLLPGCPAATACAIEPLAFGNTNRLYRLTHAGDHFLVREFGTQAALAFDRERENAMFARLARHGLAPPLIGTFAGGRIEGWLEGGPCTAAECRAPEVSVVVARALAALHAFPLEPTDTAAGNWGFVTADAWLEGARGSAAAVAAAAAAPQCSGLSERIGRIDLDRVASRLGALRERLEGAAPPLRRCYCHNDLSNTNVHLELRSGHLSLIDFEFGGVNLRGFDLATHFSHWAGGAVDGRYDDDVRAAGFEPAASTLRYGS